MVDIGDSAGLASRLARARLRVVIAFAAFAMGLCAARMLPGTGSVLWFSIAAGACAAAAATRGWACRVGMVVCVAALGAGWFAAREYEPSRDALGAMLGRADEGAEKALICVEGVVLDDPHPSARPASALDRFMFSQPRLRFDVDVDRVVTDSVPVETSGRLWVRVGGGRGHKAPELESLRAGDRVRLTGAFEPVEGPMNPGEEDMRLYAAEVGYVGSLTLSDPGLVEPAPAGGAWYRCRGSWLRWRAGLEARAREIVTRSSGSAEGDPGRALLLGLILGDYDPSQHEVRDAFARQGLAHILSISGFHLSVMALLALMLLRLTGDRGWVEPVVVALLVILYLLIIPPSSPVLRSAAMVLVLLAAEASGRRYDRLTLLGWIAIGLLIWRPLDLWSIGFELSLGLTAALFWLGNAFNGRMWGVPLKGTVHREVSLAEKALDHLKQGVSTGVMCWTVSAPLVLWRIGMISPLAIAATIIITPLIVLVLWVGYISLLVGVFIPAAADAAGSVLSFLSTWAVRSVQLFDAMPLSAVRLPVVSGAWAAAATAVAVYWVRWGHARDWRAWAGTTALAAWLGWLVVLGPALPGDVELRIDTISVGNGSCHLIRSGDEAMLWDCGPMKSGGVQPALVTTVRALGAWRTPTVVITHPDMDHFAGLPEVIEPLGIRTVILCERFVQQAQDEPKGSAGAFVRELERHGITIKTMTAGGELMLGEARLTFLSPPAGAAWKLDNDNSLVAQVDVRGEPTNRPRLLMTGDIQEDALARLESQWPNLNPVALELPHHGSAHAAAIDFTQRLNPDIVLQSTGLLRLNDPRWAPVRPGRLWYTTAHCGQAWVEFLRSGDVESGSFR